MPTAQGPRRDSREAGGDLDGARHSSPRLTEKRDSALSSLSSGNSNEADLSLLSSSVADYDHIRNTTLMFFLDRLFMASREGKEARTLHDLSCLFGTKDFTKEMRQIVGASRNGLRKFLQSYPSLFTIDGENVYLSQLRPEASQPSRDYNKEAVEYFSQKLTQFGASLVPIKNLFGYRSQASQEVRHVSGKNSREFRQFLATHDDIFEILSDDHVILKSALKELESRGESQLKIAQLASQTSDDMVMDPYLNKQFAHLVEEGLKRVIQEQQAALIESNNNNNEEQMSVQENSANSKVTIDFLYQQILKECKNPLFIKMVKTIEDFKVFLRMHPKIFKRCKCDHHQPDNTSNGSNQNECVTLLTEDERRELELQAYPSSSIANNHNSLVRQHSTLETSYATASNLSDSSQNSAQQPVSLAPIHLHQWSSTSKPKIEAEPEKRQLLGSANSSSIVKGSSSSSLRANAPPFVPSSYPKHMQINRSNTMAPPPAGSTKMSLQKSLSNLTNSSYAASRFNTSNRTTIDTRQGLRTQLVKGSLDSPAGAQYQHKTQQMDDSRFRTVSVVKEASLITSKIMKTNTPIAFDCKGYNLGFNGQITLIQLAYLPELSDDIENKPDTRQAKMKPEVFVFDLITNPEVAYILKPVLESEEVVKIVHDVRNKSNALYAQFNIMLNQVFDTQVANLVIQQQETGKPAYKSRYISMSKLCEVYGDEQLMEDRRKIKSKTRHSANNIGSANRIKDVNYWKIRPLDDAMISESTMDVYCLIGGIYQNLKSRIKPEYWPLFEQLNLEGVLARIKPEEIRSVKKERKIDLEVIELKRKLYSDTTSSIVLSNREIRLLRHIDLTEGVRQKIRHCKKVAKKLERLDLKAAQLLAGSSSLQSNNSQSSSDAENNPDQSLDPNSSFVHSNGSGSLSVGSSNLDRESSAQIESMSHERMDHLNDEVMSNIMDSSIFDELKEKMIESSSLLASLDDIDDLDIDKRNLLGHQSHQSEHQHHHSIGSRGSHQDCCRCMCHKSSTDGDREKLSLSNKSTTSQASGSEKDEDTDSYGSKAVDMAVQCDLLN